MAATRFVHPVVRPDQQTFLMRCPSCRRTILRRGEQGHRNRGFSCQMMCHSRFQNYRKADKLTVLDPEFPFKYFSFFPAENA